MAAPSSSRKRERETSAAYDAFISHRGPDTKDTVAFALYDSLEEKGFWTFLDVQELRPGDSIKSAIDDAIYSSAVQIAIFSPGYAESSWCLDELVHMLKTKVRFIPVFCDVKPSDARYPEKGVYKDAFAEHERKGRISNKRLQQWKDALHSSSQISGYEFSTSNEDVGTLCEKIVKALEEAVGQKSKGFPRSVEVARDQICLGADTGASTSTSGQVNKKSSLLPRDSHPVGIDSKVEDILSLLQNPQYPVIAVVGMGGWGKTFLVQNVYNKAKSSFDISIWLSVSKSYSVQNLQRDIANRIRLRSVIVDGAISEVAMAECIHGSLQGKKCLIVLDDLWELSLEDNLLDKLGLPAHGDCKVVVTTRNKEVAQKSKAQVYEMKKLSAKDGWDLFSFYAFPHFEENRGPPHLQEVGREIVKECGSLPLAIKTTAASLANTTALSKWESKRDQLRKRGLDPLGGHDPVMDNLKLSYDSLPPDLKPCFAYFSFFPEDEEIEPGYLVYLWIAEGFIPAGDEQLDTAWDWLDKLAQLCLVELWEVTDTKYVGSPRKVHEARCKVHDLLHDLAIHISRENRCAFSVEEATHTSAASGRCRILLAKKDIDNHTLSRSRPPYLRTLSLSWNGRIKSIPEDMFNGMRGLRVLDLSWTWISALPGCVGKMILLKVLNLRGTMIKKLPECVRNLKGLLFLAMPECEVCLHLPKWITELERLQYLEVPNVSFGLGVISKMVSLRTLRSVIFHIPRVAELSKLTHLREVSLNVKNEMEVEIVGQLVNLRRLELFHNRVEQEFLQFPETMIAMQRLEKLTLEYFAVPRWISDLVSIRELFLSCCEYSDFPEFERMPDLVTLCFWGNKGSKEFPKAFGMSGGFPHLRFLEIHSFADLNEFPQLEEGAMPYLEKFRLVTCRKLLKVVEGLELLKRLRSFVFLAHGVRQQGLVDLFVEGGEYLNKIRAMNPRVSVWAATLLSPLYRTYIPFGERNLPLGERNIHTYSVFQNFWNRN